jgi:hypothetical protein
VFQCASAALTADAKEIDFDTHSVPKDWHLKEVISSEMRDID